VSRVRASARAHAHTHTHRGVSKCTWMQRITNFVSGLHQNILIPNICKKSIVPATVVTDFGTVCRMVIHCS
jgi:hypothetical protein